MTHGARFPTITFFHSDGCERQTAEPIAAEAARRGIPVRFSDRLDERVEIGVYCQHAIRPNADFSVTMLHDLAQRHDVWPAFWRHEPWDAFDIGLLPGRSWVERWQTQADFPEARPRLGVFDLGWPKADLVFRDQAVFAREAQALRDALGLRHPRSVLYAPSWENHGKQDDFVRAVAGLPVNVLLKQAPWSTAYPQVLENIRAMNALHRGFADNVHIVDTEVSIMYCMGLADVLVSDESSVLIEALLLDVPGVAVTDWLIPDRDPPRTAFAPYDFVTRTTKADLTRTVEAILAQPAQARAALRAARERQFSHLGGSAVRIVDTIVAAVEGRPLPHAPVAAQVDLDRDEYLAAERLLHSGSTEQATDILYRMARRGTPCWEVYNDLGTLMFGRGDLDSAAVLLDAAVARAPRPVVPLANLVELHCAADRPESALEVLGRLTRYATTTRSETMAAIRQCMVSMLSA